MKARSPAASKPFIGLVTEQTTVKWPTLNDVIKLTFEPPPPQKKKKKKRYIYIYIYMMYPHRKSYSLSLVIREGGGTGLKNNKNQPLMCY